MADDPVLRIPYLCPVCGEGFYSKHERAGHLGGKHSNVRRYTTPLIHGTPSGFRKHREAGTPACQECRDAWAAYMREYRKRPKKPKEKPYLPASLERFRRT